jgi:transposase
LRDEGRQADELAGRSNRDEQATAESRDEELARLRAENGRLRKAEKSGNSSGRSCAGRPNISRRR